MSRSALRILPLLCLLSGCQCSDTKHSASLAGGTSAGASGQRAGLAAGSGGESGGSGAKSTNTQTGGASASAFDAAVIDSGKRDSSTTAQKDASVDATNHKKQDATPAGSIVLPPKNASFDYQLGGAYPPPAGVQIISRDRSDKPASGLYNICYVNGFQVQPGEESSWETDLILRDNGGNPVIDQDWNEALLDISTDVKRAKIAAKVGGWIDTCASDGFDAVEIDNLDSYSRSGGRLTQDNAVAYIALLSQAAHKKGLAIAQKNATELLSRRAQMGTDFAVAEECNRYSECSEYISTYGDYVLMIEYRDADFTKGCSQYGATYAIVKRDLELVTPSNSAYVFDAC
jgi:hypothetical protein